MEEADRPKPLRKRTVTVASADPAAPDDASAPAKPATRRAAPKNSEIATTEVAPRPKRTSAKPKAAATDKPAAPRHSREAPAAVPRACQWPRLSAWPAYAS